MSETPPIQPATQSAPPRFLPLLLFLFVGSGCAALIYEIVWLQLLQLVVGSSAVSLAVLLGTFMGGMCLGSVALPRLISPMRHPLCIYALLELGIGVCGLLVLLALPLAERVYVAGVGHGLPGILLRGFVCAVCLLPPTVLMGSTLPAISRWVKTTPEGVSWLGFFYGGNIAGAVFGCLLAGFYLLRVHDMATASYVAVAINAAVGVAGLALASRTENKTDGSAVATEPPRMVFARSSWPVYVTIALSGLCALSAEVVWTRLLSLMLGPTVYTFSIILAVFLVGLGLGSSVGSFLARGIGRSQLALGCCQLLLVAAIAWTAGMIAKSLPFWPIDPSLSTSPWLIFQLDLVRCAWAILPPTFLWGASFPLALGAVAQPGQDPGRLVGGVYAANTIGAIIGAVGASLFLIAWTGTQHSQQLLIGLSTLSGLFVLVPMLRPTNPDSPSTETVHAPTVSFARVVWLVVALGLAGVLLWRVPKTPWALVAYGRHLTVQYGEGRLLYMGEGMNASVAVTELNDGEREFHVSGKVEASTGTTDMRLQRMLGDIPALFHPNPRSVLVVGCGAGVTAGSFVVHSNITNIVLCEIEPLIPKVVAKYFARENYDVVKAPQLDLIFDDARHFVLTTQRKFDIITSDPIHPWVKGAAVLYTKEYFEMCKRHLNPGGLVTQWVPLYESNPDVVKSEIATFFDVFPNGTIWSNDENGAGYDVVLLGSVEPIEINIDDLRQRLASKQYASVKESLREVGIRSAIGLLKTYAGQKSDLAPWLAHAQINRDANLRLQYLAGMGLEHYEEEQIFNSMKDYLSFPDNLFTGSGPALETLRQALEQRYTSK